MTKILSYNDLLKRKNSSNNNNISEELYDLVIPLGTPKSIIFDIIELFDVTIKQRNFQNENFTNSTNLIVLRGELNTIINAEKFLKEEINKWINRLDQKQV